MIEFWDDGTSLYHHGILGMRWGKRNGPPYPLGADDHSASEKKAGWRKSLNKNPVDSYKKIREDDINALKRKYKKDNRGASNKEAEEFAKNIVNLSDAGRALLTAGVLVGGSVAVYAVLHKDPYGDDFTIPSGGDVFRVQGKEHPDLPKDFFYATPDTHDAKIYKGAWGREANIGGLIGIGDYKNALTIGVNKDVKVAGMKAAREVYEDLKKNNPKFASLVDVKGDPLLRAYGMDGGLDDIKTFLTHAPMDKNNTDPFIMFQDALKSKGYGGVIDYNDKFGNGYRVKAPVILFNDSSSSNNFSVKTVEELNKSVIKKYKPMAVAHILKIGVIPGNGEQALALAAQASPYLAVLGITEAVRINARKTTKTSRSKTRSK